MIHFPRKTLNFDDWLLIRNNVFFLHFCDFFCIFAKDFAKLLYLGIKKRIHLAAAARYSHVRRKNLPRPPQQFATGGASSLPPVSFPVTSRVNPCTLGGFPLSPPVFATRPSWQSFCGGKNGVMHSLGSATHLHEAPYLDGL